MRVLAIAAAIVTAAVLWDVRRRVLPPVVLSYLGAGESDMAPDVVSDAESIVDSFALAGNDMGPSVNLRAFLDALTIGEGTAGPEGYRILYGGGRFSSFDDHPAELGWAGVRLSDAQCRGAGLAPPCVSTAAGRYQITRTTWRRLKKKLSLVDFGPDSQDAAAVELIREQGALADIERGDVASAVSKVRRVWASLPGANYAGQRSVALSIVQQAFVNAGGVLA
jgi:lysozyme